MFYILSYMLTCVYKFTYHSYMFLASPDVYLFVSVCISFVVLSSSLFSFPHSFHVFNFYFYWRVVFNVRSRQYLTCSQPNFNSQTIQCKIWDETHLLQLDVSFLHDAWGRDALSRDNKSLYHMCLITRDRRADDAT